jgi:YebC/PmpR family DNA-binding regulatory protein
MAKTFTRLGKDIAIAVKESGPDPETNPRLRAIIQNAKTANMPKENVERAIKRATDKDTSDYKEVVLEGYAPHGIAILVEALTDNNNRTVANIRSYFNKYDGSLSTSGSVDFMFERKCFFKINPGDSNQEELEFELIDYGCEELFPDDEDTVLIYGSFESFGSLQKALEDRSIEIVSSGFERIPTLTKHLTQEQTDDVDKLLERLEEDEDVQNVYHNLQ